MDRKFPTFEFVIDDSAESGVKAISIVADPAFESQFITFGKTPRPTYVELEKKKRICAGLSLIPNVPVFREDEVFGKYYGFFSAETIEKIVEKYHEEMNQNKVNVNHDENDFIDAFMIEDYIVNSEARVEDLKKIGIEHQNIMGAWYTAFKIKDPIVFAGIVRNQEEGNPTGFSVEAYLDKIIVSMMKNENEKLKNKMKKEKKTLLEKITTLFNVEETKLERMLVPELGFEIEWAEVGAPVLQVTVSEEGVETMAPVGPGEFVTESGIIVVDDSSNLVEVREVEAPVEEAPIEEPALDMGEPITLPDEVLPVDEIPVEEVPVELPVEEVPVEDVKVLTIGELVGDQDGEYHIKVVVAGGVVSEAEVSSETNLLRDQVAQLSAQKEELEVKLKEPIVEPTLVPEVKTKNFKDMNAYEKTMYKRNLEK